MEVKKKRTVRLEQLIKASGQPEAVTLWTKPQDNPEFMRAVKDRRVLTIIQQNVGAKKDYGLVGFFPKELAAFWVFPKPLVLPDETKVIGIKYDRVAPAEPRGPLYKPSKKNRKPGIPLKRDPARPRRSQTKARAEKPKPPPPPREFTFRCTIQLTAMQKIDLETKAASVSEALKILKARAAELTIDPAAAKVSRKAGKPKKVS